MDREAEMTHNEENHHSTLVELYKEHKHNKYLSKISPGHRYIILSYPRPEIHATRLSHSTDLTGLEGIGADRGFRDPNDDSGLVWFSLTVTPEDLSDAETRNMKIVHPGGIEEDFTPMEAEDERGRVENRLLSQFASSPAFLSSSRYGSYRFTFDLGDVLDRYSEQFCNGWAPVMRIRKTAWYKQEVMYVVLVHSPDDNARFKRHPLLLETPNSICAFREEPEPHFLWRPQAMSETHRFELERTRDNTLFASEIHEQYYVWDHVTLALVVDDKVLRFTGKNLRRSLRFCEKGARPIHFKKMFQSYDDANRAVQSPELWPDSGNLERFNQSPFHIPVPNWRSDHY